jgi:hypothetical protein
LRPANGRGGAWKNKHASQLCAPGVLAIGQNSVERGMLGDRRCRGYRNIL